MRRALLALALAAWPAAAPGATYDIRIRGIGAGSLAVEGREEGGRYALSGRLESRGLLAAVRPFRYDATTRGQVAGGRLVPERYEEAGRRGERQSRTVVRYAGGVPGPRESGPPREPREAALDPATQAGTVDLLSGVWQLLRDVPAAEACNHGIEMFDGERRTRIVTGPPERDGETVRCAGEYRRVGGFDAEDMAERERFAFRMTYAPAGEGRLRVERLDMETVFGPGALVRR